MTDYAYEHGFGVEWSDYLVQYRQGYGTSVSDFHKHGFYEINLILSGNVTILLSDKTERGTKNQIVLTRPGTPHYIACTGDTLYRRLYLLFSDGFLAEYVPEWQKLVSIFGKSGRILTVTPKQAEHFQSLIEHVQKEPDRFRQRLIILYLLSCLGDLAQKDSGTQADVPQFVMHALVYMEEHYSEKLLAADLAKKLFVSRTVLMTGFKAHTGTTLNQYLVRCRLRHALRLLRQGKPVYEAAESCGFGDSAGFIHSFKKHYGMTPRQYLLKTAGEQDTAGS